MRHLAFLSASLSLVPMLFAYGCAGDTSSLMSVWNDSGYGGSAGGQSGSGGSGGQPASGGSGGGGVSGGGVLVVPGGVRDLATTMCVSASGGSCPVASSDITCLEVKCGSTLTKCYYSDGVASAAGGFCQSYANCMLACPCNANKSTCEDNCRQTYAETNLDCGNCIFNLGGCASDNGCSIASTCSSSVAPAGGSGGAVGGSGGVKAAGGAVGAGGVSGYGGAVPPPITVDAAPIKYDAPPVGTVDVAPMRPEAAIIATPDVAPGYGTPDVAPYPDSRPNPIDLHHAE